MPTETEQHNGNNGNDNNSNIKPDLQEIAKALQQVAEALQQVATEIKDGFKAQAAALIGVKPPPVTPARREFDV